MDSKIQRLYFLCKKGVDFAEQTKIRSLDREAKENLILVLKMYGMQMPHNAKTTRQQMIVLLSESEMSARDISQAMRIREKEVYEHLPHIARSLEAQKKKGDYPAFHVPYLWICV